MEQNNGPGRTSIHVETYCEDLKKLTEKRKLVALHNSLGSDLEQDADPSKIIEKLNAKLKGITENKSAELKANMLSIVPIKNRLEFHNTMLEKFRGKKYLGLCVKTIKELNDNLLGLRKLILLAAAPNVGKTALTIQLASEVLLTEPNACLLYVSLEMSEEEIFTRMMLYHSGLNFDTYVLGSQQIKDGDEQKVLFTAEELRKIDSATTTIKTFEKRLQIIDASTCSNLTADMIIKHVENIKNETKCSRAIVVVDYLQVWPMPSSQHFSSDIEADKWRINEIKKIRDALNKENQDPVIVISEARKPSNNEKEWGDDLSDVMGSARGTYTPDIVLLLNPIQSKHLKKLWEKMQMETLPKKWDVAEGEEEGSNIKNFLAYHGMAICSLKMAKGRDGMKRFNTFLAFNFHRNKFESINWLEIRVLMKQ